MLNPGEKISSLPMALRTSSGTSLAGVYRLSFFILSKEVLLTGVLPPTPPAPNVVVVVWTGGRVCSVNVSILIRKL